MNLLKLAIATTLAITTSLFAIDPDDGPNAPHPQFYTKEKMKPLLHTKSYWYLLGNAIVTSDIFPEIQIGYRRTWEGYGLDSFASGWVYGGTIADIAIASGPIFFLSPSPIYTGLNIGSQAVVHLDYKSTAFLPFVIGKIGIERELQLAEIGVRLTAFANQLSPSFQASYGVRF